MRDGTYTKYRINKKIKIRYEIRNGNLYGNRTKYYFNGKISMNFQFDNGKFNGTNCLLKKNGDTSFIEKYKHDTLMVTILFNYYKNHKLKSISTNWYKSDSSLYHDQFTIKPFSKIDNVSINKEFYESGKLKSYSEYENNKANGNFDQYYPNGQLESHYFMKENNIVGEFLFYDENGKLLNKKN